MRKSKKTDRIVFAERIIKTRKKYRRILVFDLNDDFDYRLWVIHQEILRGRR